MSRIDDGWSPESVEDELRMHAFTHNIEQALKGRKGQAFLRELEAALEALPVKRLAKSHFVDRNNDVCPLGAVIVKRVTDKGVDRMQAIRTMYSEFTTRLLPEDEPEELTGWDATCKASEALKIVKPLAYEVMYEADERGNYDETPEQRYERILKWVREEIK